MATTGNVGNYKIAYIKDRPNVLYSRMFDTIDSALDYGHSLKCRWLLMQKVGQSGDDYAWKILPYGASSSFSVALKVDKIRYLLIGIVVLIVLYYASKIFKSGKPTMPSF